jgi:hypothetical protein
MDGLSSCIKPKKCCYGSAAIAFHFVGVLKNSGSHVRKIFQINIEEFLFSDSFKELSLTPLKKTIQTTIRMRTL